MNCQPTYPPRHQAGLWIILPLSKTLLKYLKKCPFQKAITDAPAMMKVLRNRNWVVTQPHSDFLKQIASSWKHKWRKWKFQELEPTRRHRNWSVAKHLSYFGPKSISYGNHYPADRSSPSCLLGSFHPSTLFLNALHWSRLSIKFYDTIQNLPRRAF